MTFGAEFSIRCLSSLTGDFHAVRMVGANPNYYNYNSSNVKNILKIDQQAHSILKNLLKLEQQAQGHKKLERLVDFYNKRISSDLNPVKLGLLELHVKGIRS